MMYKRQSKTPFFLYFLLYWAFYDFAWSVLSSIVIFLLLHVKGDATTFFAVLFSPDNISWLGFLPMMFLLSYYTVGTMVDSVDIDKAAAIVAIRAINGINVITRKKARCAGNILISGFISNLNIFSTKSFAFSIVSPLFIFFFVCNHF